MKGFYHIWAWRPSWSCDLDFLYTHWFPLPIDASYKIWLWLAKRFQRRRSLKLWTDGRTDDGRTPDHGHPISSPCEPNGSGELKSPKNGCSNCNQRTNGPENAHLKPYLGVLSHHEMTLTLNTQHIFIDFISCLHLPSFRSPVAIVSKPSDF